MLRLVAKSQLRQQLAQPLLATPKPL